MSDEIRVRLIHDPFGICRGDGIRVTDLAGEKRAFREIEELLRRDERFETVTPKTFIIDARCWDHFQSYWVVRGVSVEHLSPRRQVEHEAGAKPPDWLTDEMLFAWGVHTRKLAGAPLSDSWEATVAEWFLPGISTANTLVGWLRTVASTDSFPPEAAEPVRAWLLDRFAAAATGAVPSGDALGALKADLAGARSVVEAVRGWVRRTALLPLLRHAADKVLRSPRLGPVSPEEIVLAGYLPLVFPLPEPLQGEVSDLYRRALQQARIRSPERFADAVLALNALWGHAPEELQAWLEARPNSLTAEAAKHLAALPGFEPSGLAGRIVDLYTPPPPVPLWHALDESFDGWAGCYSQFVRHCFVRRELPAAGDDPARAFGRWLKDNHTVSFSHRDRGYPTVSRAVTAALKGGRCVVLVVIDALAVHAAEEATRTLGDALDASPTRARYIFAPLPTITEVCKEAIITGRYPAECRGNLAATVQEAYELEPDELLLAANWEDAERLQVKPTTRLVVYRENRLDDHLKTAGSYRILLEDCLPIFKRVARLVARWADDLRSFHRVAPLVLLTADHGFTYGPEPQPQVPGAAVPEGHSRCVELPDRATNLPPQDESVTLIDKRVFHLRSSYLAARGRYFGKDEAAAWVMSHGGLLPEEVIIPVVEWFGDEAMIPWPEVAFEGGAERDYSGWVVRVVVRNHHAVPIYGGTLKLALSGERPASAELPRLEPGRACEFVKTLAGGDLPEDQQLPIDLTIGLRYPGATREVSRSEQYLVPRRRKLVERTREQAAFEEMF